MTHSITTIAKLLILGALIWATFISPTVTVHGNRQSAGTQPNRVIGYDRDSFTIDGRDVFIYSGSMHPFRCPKPLWEDRLMKIKQAGINTVQSYVPWNYFEKVQGESEFSDLEEFIELCEKLGLFFIVRIGPNITCEWDHGGFPDWLIAKGIRNSSLRTNEAQYVKYVNKWYEQLVPVLRSHLVTNGGNVILIQVENEYGGGAYYKREVLRDRYRKVTALGVDVPVVTCNTPYAWDNTDPDMANIINGNNSTKVRWGNISVLEQRVSEARREEYNAPTIILEMPGGQGMHSNFVGYEAPQLDFLDFEVVSKTALMEGAALTNYYMLYGGTNLAYWGASYQSTSYANKPSVQCPIDEPGGLTQSYYSVKLTGQWLNEFGSRKVKSRPLAEGAKIVAGGGSKPPRIVQKVYGDMAFLFIREEEGKEQKIRLSYTDLRNEETVVVPQKDYLTLPPRSMKILVTNVPLRNQTMKYCTSEILDVTRIGNRTVVLLYAPEGAGGEAAIAFSEKPELISTESYSWDEKTQLLTVNYIHSDKDSSILLDDIQLVVVSKHRAYGSWSVSRQEQALVLISDAYLLRDHRFEENQIDLEIETRPGDSSFTAIIPDSPKAVICNDLPLAYEWNKDGTQVNFELSTSQLPDMDIEFQEAKFTTDEIDEGDGLEVEELLPLEFLNVFDKGYITYSAFFEPHGAESMVIRFYEGSAKSSRSRQTVGDPVMVFVNGKYVPEASGWHPRKIRFDLQEYLEPGRNKVQVILEKIGRPCGAGGWGMGEPKGLAAVSLMGGNGQLWMKKVNNWKIAIGTHGQNEGFFAPDFDDSSWQTVRLGNWKQHGIGASEFDGIGWYRLAFDLDLPQQWEIPLKLRLRAETDALIYLNGTLIGRYHGIGWQREFYLHDSYLNPQGRNRIAIAVRNDGKEGGLYEAAVVPYEQYSVKKNRIQFRF